MRGYRGDMDWADVVIVAVLLIALVRGWSTGALRQLGRMIGRLVGLGLALFYAPSLTRGLHPVALRDGAVIALVVVSAPIGGWILFRVAGMAAEGLTGTVLGVLDRVGGAVISLLGTLVAVWLVVAVASVLSWGVVAQQVNRSLIAHTLDRLAPSPPAALASIESLFSSAHVPSLVDGLILPSLGTVPSAHSFSGSVTGTVALSASGGCSRNFSGEAVIVSAHDVVTAAHLVVGQTHIRVAGETARIVAVDAVGDLALLRVAGSLSPTYGLSTTLHPPAPATIVGPPNTVGATHWSAVVVRRVTVQSRGLYGGAPSSRPLLLVATSRHVGVERVGAAVVTGTSLVGVVVEPSPIQAGVVYATPIDVISHLVASASTTPVSTRCVS